MQGRKSFGKLSAQVRCYNVKNIVEYTVYPQVEKDEVHSNHCYPIELTHR